MKLILNKPVRKFNQVVKGNVNIKKFDENNKNKYIITFNKISNFLRYQIWSDSNMEFKYNEKRLTFYEDAKKWVTNFKNVNKKLKEKKKPLFLPTTIMEIENNNYIFVINDANVNSKGDVVFQVSTKEIDLVKDTSQELLKLPLGNHNNVRFDIDSMMYTSNDYNGINLCAGVYQGSPWIGVPGFPAFCSWINIGEQSGWYTVFSGSANFAAKTNFILPNAYCLINCSNPSGTTDPNELIGKIVLFQSFENDIAGPNNLPDLAAIVTSKSQQWLFS